MLDVKGLSVVFPDRFGSRTAIEAIDLSIAAGEIHGLVGESGAGKSTIGAAIIGLLPEPGYVSAGSIVFDDQELTTLSPRERHSMRGKRISMIFQDPQTSLNPLMTIEQQLVETILAHEDIGLDAARARAIDLLAETGIADPATRIKAYPHQFSGGMRQRVVIALALCSNPDLIIADEPTTALDVAVQSLVLDLIRDLATKRKIGVLLITHDIGVISQVCDRVSVLRNGRLIESGDTRQVLAQPEADYTRQLMASIPRLGKKLHRFVTIEPEIIADAKLTRPKGRIAAGASAEFAADWLSQRPTTGDAQAGDALNIDDLSVTFGGEGALFRRRTKSVQALKNVSLTVRRGEVLGLIGESGSGKSTLAKSVVGLVMPTAGNMTLLGEALPDGRHRRRDHPSRRSMQMIFQDPYSSLNNRRQVADILTEPLQLYRIATDRPQQLQLVASILELVGLPQDVMWRYPHQFSGGQRQRIAIARALLARPEFLICDEPTSALDVSIQAQILNLLKDLQERFALTILFISHNMAVVRQMADSVAVLKAGELVEFGPAEPFFEDPQHEYSRELLRLTPSPDQLDS